jgi:hypothetical protein
MLMWRVTKAGFASLTSQVAWRRLAHGVAILFLFTHQGWTGIVCDFHHEGDAQHVSQMAHACFSHHSGSAVSAEHANEAVHSSASCSEEGAPGTAGQRSDDQLDTLLQGAAMCCHAAPQTEQNATLSAQVPGPVVSTQPLGSLDGQSVSVPARHNYPQLYPTRPLYLSFSCFLI